MPTKIPKNIIKGHEADYCEAIRKGAPTEEQFRKNVEKHLKKKKH